ncbi:Aste57867_2474 [Aphanomyces stellatus]|uniref:Aste57867_2474 protein n=1 Tax=Aphanomyces stellatus TaxID=120398 RepID=A0A485K8D2_9STRA|nr:hypothetical protein As57867_002468 [Aphanomyces stellatus]VFT79673.1 Aste57867_2474 [Aphanomyces stellatus]
MMVLDWPGSNVFLNSTTAAAPRTMLQDEFLAMYTALEESARKNRTAKEKEIETSLRELEAGVGRRVDKALENIIALQQQLQDACIDTGKRAVQRHQKIVRWKAELKRFQANVADLEPFEKWLEMTEGDMHLLCGKLEYVCHQLSRAAATETPSSHSAT